MKNKINVNCYQDILIKDEDNKIVSTIINLIPNVCIQVEYQVRKFTIVFNWLGLCVSIDNYDKL